MPWVRLTAERRMKSRLVVVSFVALFAACQTGRSEVAARYDLCFREDYPGASDRYVEYTPVRCSEPTVKVSEPIGGEQATLEVVDVDGDRDPEIVVSSEFWCRWGFEPCLDPTRTTLKVKGTRERPEITVISEERLVPAKEFR